MAAHIAGPLHVVALQEESTLVRKEKDPDGSLPRLVTLASPFLFNTDTFGEPTIERETHRGPRALWGGFEKPTLCDGGHCGQGPLLASAVGKTA